MVERKRIALIFSYNENWIAGTYYILNLASALNTLPDEQKPEITLCTSTKNEFKYFSLETKYPYLCLFEMNNIKTKILFLIGLLSRIIFFLFKKKLSFISIKKKCLLQNDFDLVFPNPDSNYFELIKNEKKAYWIPDFQEDYLQDMFSKQDIVYRKQDNVSKALLADKLVFSSYDAQKDFNRLYPFAICKQYVLPFAVTHPEYEMINIEKLKLKHNIKRNYFFTPNQFWAHKNHKIVIEAIAYLKDKGVDVLIVFSGKEIDQRNEYRNQSYVTNLKELVKIKSLDNNILFLGFIDRKELLCLMNNAIAIIQPSLFEGWSTVIEDAKAMNQFVIASNLKVHKEQIKQIVLFFNPNKAKELAKCIENIQKLSYIEKKDNNYRNSVEFFAQNFMSLIN
jgi:glycosyltransferase involved in cell wall biosynthesis